MLFKRLKEELIRLKDEGRVLMQFNEMREPLQLRVSGEFKRFVGRYDLSQLYSAKCN